jgi:hypothetical protein
MLASLIREESTKVKKMKTSTTSVSEPQAVLAAEPSSSIVRSFNLDEMFSNGEQELRFETVVNRPSTSVQLANKVDESVMPIDDPFFVTVETGTQIRREKAELKVAAVKRCTFTKQLNNKLTENVPHCRLNIRRLQ